MESGSRVLRETPRAVPRPLVLVAAAIAAGSGSGASGLVGSEEARWLTAASILGLLFTPVLVRGDHRSSLCTRVACAALLSILASAAALRAVVDRAPARASAAADEVAAGTEGIGGPVGIGGEWRRSSSFGDGERGVLAGTTEAFAFDAGLVEEGEHVHILSGSLPTPLPRGPAAAPLARSSPAAAEVMPDEIVRIAACEPGALRACAERLEALRRALVARTFRLHDPLTRGLVAALLFGEMSELPRGVSDLFVRTGTFHVLAISGMQVGLAAVLLLWPLGALLAWILRSVCGGRSRLGPEPFRILLMTIFVPLCGAGAPVMRSALAYAIGSLGARIRAARPFVIRPGERLGAVWMRRKADSLSLWSLALILECLAHADAPLSLSVQLSYGATLGLIVGTGPMLVLLRSALGASLSIDAVGRTGRARWNLWRIPLQRGLDVSLIGVAASLAAVLATLPFVWTRFGEWSPVGILATPALTLPMAGLLCASWLWILAPGLVPEILLDVPSRVMTASMELFDLVPGSPTPLPPRPFILLFAATLATIVWLARARVVPARIEPAPVEPARIENGAMDGEQCRSNRWSGALARAGAFTWAIAIAPWSLAPRGLELWALDVGHGTAVLVRAPGNGTWIFDAGSRDRPDVARRAALPLLAQWEAGTINVVLSHCDRDHDGALPHILERYPPRLWAGALPAHIAERIPHDTLHLDIGVGRIDLPSLPGSPSCLGFELLRGADCEGNEGSRSLCVRWGKERILLCGDAEAEGLSAWLASHPDFGPVRLLLFPHHGSDTPLLAALLASARPAEVWISAPGIPPVARELDRRGVRWRCTGRDGPLGLEVDAHAPGAVLRE